MYAQCVYTSDTKCDEPMNEQTKGQGAKSIVDKLVPPPATLFWLGAKNNKTMHQIQYAEHHFNDIYPRVNIS